MSWLNVLAVPIVALIAMGHGRKFIFWSICAFFFGFWVLIPLLLLPKREKAEPEIPKIFIALAINQHIKKEMKGIKYSSDIL
jgi:ATP/ADP translocase